MIISVYNSIVCCGKPRTAYALCHSDISQSVNINLLIKEQDHLKLAENQSTSEIAKIMPAPDSQEQLSTNSVMRNKLPDTEKVLPPSPPFNPTNQGEAFVNIASNLSDSPSSNNPILAHSQSSIQRPRKRVTWRGKACTIALPMPDENDGKANDKSYLTPQDVENRLSMWKRQGFDTKGFDLSSISDSLVADSLNKGQSCVVYPDAANEKKEHIDRPYRVSIPDLQAWEDYVNYLREDKLRALGVSFRENELSTLDSSILPLVSRNISSQSSANPGSPTGSRTAPVPQHNEMPTSHFSRYSMSFSGVENNVSTGYQQPKAQSPISGTWLPEQYHSSQSNSRVTSPSADGHIQSLSNALVPSLSGVQNPRNSAFNHPSNELLPKMRHQQTQIQAQLVQHQHQYQHQRNQQFLEPRLMQSVASPCKQAEIFQSAEYNSQPEIVNPVPRGHRQNLSETLQKEVDEAESRSVESKQPEMQENRNSLGFSIEEGRENTDDTPFLANILQDVNRDVNIDNFDLDTNPSLSGTPKPQGARNNSIERNNSVRPSLSQLNVNAPEFVFEPKKTIVPEIFAFLGSQSHESITGPAIKPWINSDSTHTNQEAISHRALNIAAQPFIPATSSRPMAPSRVFSFSSKVPSSRLDTSKLEDSSACKPTFDMTDQTATSSAKKIFGDIKFSEIIKPVQQSSAIPIVDPEALPEISDQVVDLDGQEDESGRITQPDGRQKRVRRADNDSKELPLFHRIPAASNVIESPNSTDTSNMSSKRVKDNAPLDKTGNLLNVVINDLPISEISSLPAIHEAMGVNGQSWEPFSFNDAEDAAIFNAARSVLPLPGKDTNRDTLNASRSIEDTDFRNRLRKRTSSLDESSDSRVEYVSCAIRDVQMDSLPAVDGVSRKRLNRTLSGTSLSHVLNKVSPPLGRASSVHSGTLSQLSVSTEAPNKYIPESSEDGNKAQRDSVVLANSQGSQFINDVSSVQPSYNEIDAVMKHFNEEDSEFGVERNQSPWGQRNPTKSPASESHKSKAHPLLPIPHVRSDAPSPSPNRLQQPFQYLPEYDSRSPPAAEVEMIARNARYSPSYRPSKTSKAGGSPIHRLNSLSNAPISEWDDAISSTEETQFRSKAAFFDYRINDVVGAIIQQRLSPIEKTLANIQVSINALPSKPANGRSRRSASGEIDDSDADDEDELDVSRSNIKSPPRDRTYEMIKALFLESNTGLHQSIPVDNIADIMQTMKDIKASIQVSPQPLADIKSAVEDAVARQMRGKSRPIVSSHESATVEKLQLQITGLESMLKIAEARADDELKARRATEDALADSQRLLRVAMQEAAEQRESAEETERSLSAFHDEKQHVLRRTAMLEGIQESLQKTASDLSEKNMALEGTLAEYRLSSSQWREEIEEAKLENKHLQKAIDTLKVEIEDNIRGRETLRTKFDRLQEHMIIVSHDITRDQSRWRYREEEYRAKFESMNAKLEAESQTREKLECEIMSLLNQEKETAMMQHSLKQSQHVIHEKEELIGSLRMENVELQKNAARLERGLHHVEESAKLEIQRTRASMESEIETANNQVNIVSSDLQQLIARLQVQIDDAKTDAEATKSRDQAMLEEVLGSRSSALREAAEAREAALQEHYRFHERTLEDIKSEQSRALRNALEDKQRLESHLSNRLILADEKALLLHDKVCHLEDKLEIAKKAARVAALAAQPTIVESSPLTNGGSQPLARGLELPERISPQALRESIMVLQEQLQEREGRIEQLEQEMSDIDQEAPVKLKNQEIEISWLRELLGVRIDDLNDIIVTLSKPSYNHEAVKDAAIRLKANLQMEQQEKERAYAGNPKFPSLSTISSLASSPRALPLAAAAAWGSWRKTRDNSFGSLSGIANGGINETPSRSSPPTQSFLSGLLTPPGTHMRRTGQPYQKLESPRSTQSNIRPSLGTNGTASQSLSFQDENQASKSYNPPQTPPLMREASYDSDAECTELSGTDKDNMDAKSFNTHMDEVGEEPFGLTIGNILQ